MAKLDWDVHRDDIERLYISEGKTLAEVIAILKSTKQFSAR